MNRPRVQHPPIDRPLMLFDGDCGFCRYWVERWSIRTGERVEYRPYQEARDAFPEIAEESYRGAVQLIEPSGEVYGGAAAIFRALYSAQKHPWLWGAYDGLPGFAWLCELAYSCIARNRGWLSRLMVWLGMGSVCSRRP